MPNCFPDLSFNLIFGYAFGYRHQLGFFTLNLAKLHSSIYLRVSETTPNYAYFS